MRFKMFIFLMSSLFLGACNIIPITNRDVDKFISKYDGVKFPFHSNDPAYLLRLKTITGDSIVRKGYDFELYKDRWYLNTTR